MTTPTVEHGRVVALSFPAQSGFLSLCRVNVSAAGAIAGLDIDDLDELRMAVTEVVTWLVAAATPDATLTVEVRIHSQRLTLTASCPDSGRDVAELDDLASAILGACVDSFEATVDAGVRELTLVKKSSVDG